MNENLNLIEKLKNVPKGTKLWSPLCGECTLHGIDMLSDVPIIVEVKRDENNEDCILRFAANGKYFSRLISAECILFPSKNNRDWAYFKAPWKHKYFEPFQKVLIPGIIDNVHYWFATLYSHYDSKHKLHVLIDNRTVFEDNEIIPYERNEDKLGEKVK